MGIHNQGQTSSKTNIRQDPYSATKERKRRISVVAKTGIVNNGT